MPQFSDPIWRLWPCSSPASPRCERPAGRHPGACASAICRRALAAADPRRLGGRVRRRRPRRTSGRVSTTCRCSSPTRLADRRTRALDPPPAAGRARLLLVAVASLQATLTPDLGMELPQRLLLHVLRLPRGRDRRRLHAGLRLRPATRARGGLAGFAATLAFAAVAGAADLITGGNYMYLRSQAGPQLAAQRDGPWPWYIVAVALLALVMLLALQWLADGSAGATRPRGRAAQPRRSAVAELLGVRLAVLAAGPAAPASRTPASPGTGSRRS